MTTMWSSCNRGGGYPLINSCWVTALGNCWVNAVCYLVNSLLAVILFTAGLAYKNQQTGLSAPWRLGTPSNSKFSQLSASRQHIGPDRQQACEAPGRLAAQATVSGVVPSPDANPLLTSAIARLTAAAESRGAQDVYYEQDTFVEVGWVIGAFGVRGEVKIKVLTDQSDARFKTNSRLFLRPPASKGTVTGNNKASTPLLQVTVASSKNRPLPGNQSGQYIKFAELHDRDEAGALQGCTVMALAAERSRLQDADEFYLQDLIGCRVHHQVTGFYLGTVTEVFDGTGTYDTLTIRLRPNANDIRNSVYRQTMVPFVKEMCPVVETAKQYMEVAPPEGLLDLTTEHKTRKPLTLEQKEYKLMQLQQEDQQRQKVQQAKSVFSAATLPPRFDSNPDHVLPNASTSVLATANPSARLMEGAPPPASGSGRDVPQGTSPALEGNRHSRRHGKAAKPAVPSRRAQLAEARASRPSIATSHQGKGGKGTDLPQALAGSEQDHYGALPAGGVASGGNAAAVEMDGMTARAGASDGVRRAILQRLRRRSGGPGLWGSSDLARRRSDWTAGEDQGAGAEGSEDEL